MAKKKQILLTGGLNRYREVSDGSFPAWTVMEGTGGAGDMLKATYDTNNNGKVDTAENAEKLGGTLANQFVQTTDPRLSDARSASDVSAWAKALTKPTYTADEVGAPSGSGSSTGTNTGDETTSTIKTKLGVGSTSTDGYVTSTDWNTFNGKQANLVSGTNIKTINGASVLGSGDIVISAGGAGSDTTAIHKDASNEYSSVTEKTLLVDNDVALIEDSESSYSKKKWKFSSIKSYLQTAFNSVYSLISDQGDRHGFYNASNSSFSFDNTTRTLTITPTSPYIIYINGSKYNITVNKTVSFANTTGQWFITFSISGGSPVLNASQTTWSLLDLTQIPVAIISWNGVSGRILDERHSSKRNLVWHDSEHNSVGARYRSGFSSITPTSSNTFSLSSGVIADEDIILDTGGTQTTCQIMYRNPGLTFMTWDASSAAYIKTGANGRPVYDNSGMLTEIANNNYSVYYLTMTNCIESGKKIVSIMAQSQYASLTAAQASAIPVVLANVAEWKYLYRIIVKASANGFTYIESNPLYNLSTGLAISSGTVTSVSAASVTLTPFDGITATNVQDGLEQVNAKTNRELLITYYSTNGVLSPVRYKVGSSSITITGYKLTTGVTDISVTINGSNYTISTITGIVAAAGSEIIINSLTLTPGYTVGNASILW